MITITKTGTYQLTETKHGVRLLHMPYHTYAWIVARHIGAILVRSRVPHQIRDTLSQGAYRLYSVVNEPHLSDQLHLELEFAADKWQGYVLPTGLPTRMHPRTRIIPTTEIITHNPRFRLFRGSGVPAKRRYPKVRLA